MVAGATMHNKVSGHDEVSILQRLDRSSPDALLQSIARELFRVDQVNAQLNARISAMESLLAVSDRIASSEEVDFAAKYPERVNIDAADSFLGSLGFYEVEHDKGGLPYRWSGPDRQFSFQFFVNRLEPLHFILKFGQFYADVPVELLQCYVDGEKIALIVGGAGDRHEAKGVLPPRKDRGGTVLTFICPEIVSPESLGYSDLRQLGLTFYQLTVDTQQALAATISSTSSIQNTTRIIVSSDSEPGAPVTEAAIVPKSAVESGSQEDSTMEFLAVSDRVAATEPEELAAQYPDGITIDAADSFLGPPMFHQLERDNDGLPYRWSGPEKQFSFEFFVNRLEPLHFNFKFGQFYADVPVERLQCYVDGEKIALILGGAGSRHEAKGLLHPRKYGGRTILTFVCPEIGSPASRGYSDRRQLGLTFYQLTVESEKRAAIPTPMFSIMEKAPMIVSKESETDYLMTAALIPPTPPVESASPPKISPVEIAEIRQLFGREFGDGVGMRAEAERPLSQNIFFSDRRVLVKKEG